MSAELHPAAETKNYLGLVDIGRIQSLEWLSLANYWVFVWGALGCVQLPLALFPEPSWMIALLLYLGMPAYGFLAYSAWQNITLVDMIRSERNQLALRLVSAVAAILLAAFWFEAGADRLSNRKIDSVERAAMVLFATLLTLALVEWLRRHSLPGFQMPLGVFLNNEVMSPRGAIKASRPRDPSEGAALVLSGIVGLFVMQLLILAKSYIFFDFAPFAFFLYARQCFQPDFTCSMDGDERAPVLFLRSFGDDPIARKLAGTRGVLDFSLESRLAPHFELFGPFIAIGSAKERFSHRIHPHIGALRTLVDDDQWQGAVLDWMKRSLAILYIVGKTKSVVWELQHVLSEGHSENC